MAKEMNCTNYYPGPITRIDRQSLNNILLLTKPGDNQRQTEWYYIYPNDSLLGGI